MNNKQYYVTGLDAKTYGIEFGPMSYIQAKQFIQDFFHGSPTVDYKFMYKNCIKEIIPSKEEVLL